MKGLIFGFKADWKETYFWKFFPDIKVGAELRIFDILTHKSSQLQALNKAGGAHNLYEIPKKIPLIMSSIMPDNNLDCLSIEDYIKYAEIINPNLLTSIEVPLYSGDYDNLFYKKIKEYYYQLSKLKEKFGCDRIIVLIPGRDNLEVEEFAKITFNFGFRKMGLPCSDPLQRNKNKTLSNIKNDLMILKKYANQIYLFGLTSPTHIENFSYADYIVTKGWYYKTMKFKEILTHKGAVRVPIPVIDGKKQKTISIKKGICLIDNNIIKEKRMKLKQKYCLENIKVLLSKFYSIKSQTKLEEFFKCPIKEHPFVQAIAK